MGFTYGNGGVGLIDYVLILARKYYGQHYSILNNDYDTLQWESDSQKPSKDELEALWLEVQAEVSKERTDAQRMEAYAKESDPLFFKWQRGESSEEEWLNAVQAIKERYPYAF